MHRAATVCECGDHAFVGLTRGKVALLDPAFAPAANLWRWHAHRDNRGNYYARRSFGLEVRDKRHSFTVPMHRMVMPLPDGMMVDHIDGDTLNNRLSNLRPATTGGNVVNRRKRFGTMSQYRGVTRAGRRWQALVTVDGQQHYLGAFDDEAAAARAYDEAAIRLHGPFARPNFAVPA